MEDTSHLKIGERRIDDAHGCPASRSSPPAGLAERAEMRRTKKRSQGYHGHIPSRFDKPVPQPGDRGDVKQGYISHVPADSGHFDMPNTTKEPQVTDLGQRTIERTTSLRGRLFSPLKHLGEASNRASVSSLPLPALPVMRARVLDRGIVCSVSCAVFRSVSQGLFCVVQPRGTAKGVGMGYAGHVPLLFGGTKQTTGVAPSLLNGSDLDGLDSQPSVNVSHFHVSFEPKRFSPSVCVCAVRAVDADGLPQRPLLPGGVAAAEVPQDRARPRVAQLLRCATAARRRSFWAAFSHRCAVCGCRRQPRTAGPRFSDRPRLSDPSALAVLHVLPVGGAGGWWAGAAAAAAQDAVGAAREAGADTHPEPAPPAPVRHHRSRWVGFSHRWFVAVFTGSCCGSGCASRRCLVMTLSSRAKSPAEGYVRS